MSRTFSKKFMYVIVVLSVLAMMIPMAIPVSAAGGTLEMTLPADDNATDYGYNAAGAIVRVTVVGDDSTVLAWNKVDYSGASAQVGGLGTDWADFTGIPGTEASIYAIMADNTTVGPITKKWGEVTETIFTQSEKSSSITWDETTNEWSGSASITDTVIAKFNEVEASKEYAPDGVPNTTFAQGMILNWYLIEGWQTVRMVADEAAPGGDYTMGNCGYVDGLAAARFTTFDETGTTYIQTITDANGASTVTFSSTGAESVKIVVVPEYPGDPELLTVPEVATYSFNKVNIDAVPQVQWAGQKAILEANFGEIDENSTMDYVVKFSLTNDSPGQLTAVNEDIIFGFNYTNTTQTVWTYVDDATGYFPVAVECQTEGQIWVDANLYAWDGEEMMPLSSQQSFRVIYLEFEELVLSDVIGKRVLTNESGIVISHKEGIWTEGNPWDPTLDWEYVHADDGEIENDTRNVSADALLRARVKGWFEEGKTTRPEGYITVEGAEYELVLPAGRYVLPDDWGTYIGNGRTHWDIMCDPSQLDVLGVTPAGPYYANYGAGNQGLVAAAPVVGPFSPSIEEMTLTGWNPAIVSQDELRMVKTVVPDGLVNSWDAPMPPAKIIFDILDDEADDMDNVGFFKAADKSEIYYVANDVTGVQTAYLWTNPFYAANIPAHEYLIATSVNGHYDWDSFGKDGVAYGPYNFWEIMDPVIDNGKPIKVEVYSDNHGEAMVYINGDYNLNLEDYDSGLDIPYGSVVGSSTIIAEADYPNFRNLEKIISNTVKKTWTWGGQILGPDSQEGSPMVLVAGTNNPVASDYIYLDPGFTWEGVIAIDPETGYSTEPDALGKSNKHVVWVWVSDRDGMQAGVLDSKVDWVLSGAEARFFNTTNDWYGINPMFPSSQLHFDANGFLYNGAHPGERAAGANVNTGTSWLRAPDAYESMLFNKFWGINAADPMYGPDGEVLSPNNFAVTAIEIVTSGDGTVHVDETITSSDFAPVDGTATEGSILRQVNFSTGTSETATAYPLDDPIVLGDANLDGVVNTMDITAVERIILGMDPNRVVQADANYDQVINMGDVIRIEKIYLNID